MTTPLAYTVPIHRDQKENDSVRQVHRTKTSFGAVPFDPDGKGEIGFLPEGAMLRVLGPSSGLREGFEVEFEEQVYNIFKADLFGRCVVREGSTWQSVTAAALKLSCMTPGIRYAPRA
jgi:hypothetical protein